jgi:hypothetical protein
MQISCSTLPLSIHCIEDDWYTQQFWLSSLNDAEYTRPRSYCQNADKSNIFLIKMQHIIVLKHSSKGKELIYQQLTKREYLKGTRGS